MLRPEHPSERITYPVNVPRVTGSYEERANKRKSILRQLEASHREKQIVDFEIPKELNRTKKIKIKLGNRHGWVCQLCQRPFTNFYEISLDHILPVSRGGTDGMHNLQLAHKKCNGIKGGEHIDESPDFFINYKGVKRARREAARKKNYELSKQIAHVELPIPKPHDFKVNHIANLWNEIVENRFENLSYQMFEDAFNKYAAVKLKMSLNGTECAFARKCSFQSAPK